MKQNEFLFTGTKNYVLVECPYITTFLSCNIQDISSDGKTEVLPIQNMRNNMLLCGPFLPHNDPFYIQVCNYIYFKFFQIMNHLPNK